MLDKNQHRQDAMRTNFQEKRTTLTFSVEICPENRFWGRNFKNQSPDSESAFPRYHVYQFSIKTDNFDFFGPNLPKKEITI